MGDPPTTTPNPPQAPPAPPLPTLPLDLEQLESLSDADLYAKANEWLQELGRCGYEQRPAVLNLVRFYQGEIDRRADAKATRKSYRLEWLVVLLIIGEIVLTFYEGWSQGKVLDRMDASTANTATKMKDASDDLKSLVADQKESLSRQGDTNAKLQDSIKQSGIMVTALQNQLTILQNQQAEHQAQLLKKPKLELQFGSEEDMQLISGLRMGQFPPPSVELRSHSEDSVTFDVRLDNRGDGAATGIRIRVKLQDRYVTVESEPPSKKEPEPKNSPIHIWSMYPDSLKAPDSDQMIVTFKFEKGRQAPFQVTFEGDSTEIEREVLLSHFNYYPGKRQVGQ
jgi:hypothetical protein